MNTHARQAIDALRIEEAAMNAWPALHQQFYDGWVLRFAKGFTKRANSIVPLYAPSRPLSASDLAHRVRFCENLYAQERLQTVFRLTDISPAPELDGFLATRGYEQIDLTQVLARRLAAPGEEQQPPDPGQALKLHGLEEWIEIYSDLAAVPAAAKPLHASLLRAIQGTAAFAVVHDAGAPRACGLAVLEDGLLGLFDIVTGAAARRQGYARRLVQGLLAWGAQAGAHTTYLQVLATNTPAAALYADAGFESIYRYWYRVST